MYLVGTVLNSPGRCHLPLFFAIIMTLRQATSDSDPSGDRYSMVLTFLIKYDLLYRSLLSYYLLALW